MAVVDRDGDWMVGEQGFGGSAQFGHEHLKWCYEEAKARSIFARV